MNRNDSYKDSGVEWIGEIPNGWKKSKVKYHFHLISGFPFSSEDITNEEREYPIIRIGNVTSGKTDVYFEGELSEKHPLVNYGDYVVSLTGDFSIRKWENKSSLLNQRCGLIKKFTSDDERFLFYYLPFQFRILEKTKYFTTLKNLSNRELLDIDFILPPLSEQQQIVSFLDTKTSQIDSLIEKTQRKIELLKEKRNSLINEVVTKGLNPNVEMKDSGVRWIGEIPSHWDRTKIKRHCEVKDGTHDTPEYLDLGENTVPLVTSNSFVKGEIDFTVSKHISFDDYIKINKRSNVTIDDIIMSMIGSNIGNRILVKSSQPFSIKNVCLFKTSESNSLIPKYLIYLIDSKYLKYQIDFNQKGGGQPFLSLDELRNLLFPFPPILEQQQIVEYLDEQTGLIDKTISIEEKRIELLKEYRQSLISEVVTGKRKVVE